MNGLIQTGATTLTIEHGLELLIHSRCFAVSESETFQGPKSCSQGFTNYWQYGCYRQGTSGNWANSEAHCQSYGPNVHLAGMKY